MPSPTVLHFYISLALCADRDVLDRTLHFLLNVLDVLLSVLGKLLKLLAAGYIAHPTVHLLVYRLSLCKSVTGREYLGYLAVNVVSYAYGYLGKIRKYIESVLTKLQKMR